MSVEHDGIERIEGGVSKQINCFDFQLECLTIRKNPLFYRAFGHNRSIKTIDGYDETVHDGPFKKVTVVKISLEGPDDPVDKRHKNA